MFYKIEKLQNRIHDLNRLRYRALQTIGAFRMHEPEKGLESILPQKYGTKEMKVNDTWSGRDRYIWLHTMLQIPEQWTGKKAVLFLDMGRTGGGNNSGFESLLYVNKQPFQGVDSNHQEVILPDITGELEIDILLWSGLEGGGTPSEQFYRLKEAWVGWLDEEVDAFYYKAKAILDSIKRLNEHDSIRSDLMAALDRVFYFIDWSLPGSDAFYESTYKALDALDSNMKELAKNTKVTVHTIGHSHIDLAWLWRTKHTKEKAKRTFSTVLRLMDLYPDYTYLQSQPQLYEWIKKEDPELFEKIKEKVKDGQWEVEGAMWVEADCNIPSGESFVRQLLYGKRFFQKEFNKTNRTLWLPDVFGYSWSLPQLLRKSGIDTFMTTKISWNQYNRMPHDTFKWRGIDGSEILTHFITTPEPGRPEDSWFYTYNGLVTAETVNGVWEKYRDKGINKDLLLAYGYGDGGGGVNREMLEMKRQLDTVPGIPNVQSTKAENYFQRLHETISETDQYVHIWDGELYLEYHRGTYTSQAKMKQMNRKLEFLYKESEFISLWNSVINGWNNYPAERMEEGWKLILLNQFHDIIPGSSITEVYEDAHKDYEKAVRISAELVGNQEAQIVEKGEGSWSYVHPHQYEAEALLTIPDNADEQAGFEQNGGPLLSQKTAKGKHLVLIERTKPYSYQSITSTNASNNSSGLLSQVDLAKRTWETPHYRLKWNEEGHLTTIFDIEANREMLKHRSLGNVFKLYEDKPLAHDAWDIDLFYQEKYDIIQSLKDCSLVDNGPLRTTIRFAWDYQEVQIEQYVHCYLHTKRIDFETKINWEARQKLLKVEFPVGIRSTEAIYDIQFGNVKRPTHWNTSWDMARFETVGHKWAAITEPNYGIGLMNDSKYGYSIKDNVMALTLLKGPVYPDPQADIGIHLFTYSIYPFKGPAHKHDIEREATYLNAPLRVAAGKVKEEFTKSLFTLNNDRIVLDTIKKAEDRESTIIRLHEMEGSTEEVVIDSSYSIGRWREVNLMEDEGYMDFNEGPINLSFTPYEVKTIELEFNR
ncbi:MULTISPECIES: alpha-mannosidase [unclassified Sutcliffiella]|uniref:alpha-mannosidase n=1 Tax=unclassified Sutcliffiella TaxID=2837532 RepID=UPI0030D0E0AD